MEVKLLDELFHFFHLEPMEFSILELLYHILDYWDYTRKVLVAKLIHQLLYLDHQNHLNGAKSFTSLLADLFQVKNRCFAFIRSSALMKHFLEVSAPLRL